MTQRDLYPGDTAMAVLSQPLVAATASGSGLSETAEGNMLLSVMCATLAWLLKARAAGVIVTTLSSDATSIAPPNMFENMRLTWNIGIPWKGTDTEGIPPISFQEVIEMATINGARALGLASIAGSLTPGKRADLILIRTTDLNIAPLAQIETTVVQAATPANVDTVMVDGHIIKRAGHLMHFDVPEIVHRAERSALRIRQGPVGC
jgi:5-methylthioadenosine/S-adenosylhomocysteine deaminase